ncbi:MAG: branched-chain amino acid ABC transporter permease [Alphaproteobacteria bacterium]|nr:MAG: branched-chain amino acid ABC transporter permease [Alphaproteobacteria bacterium]
MKTDFFSEKKYINAYLVCAFLFLLVGLFQSWNVAFSILNLCLISAIMSIGINIQWGNSGIVNFGVMGFAAIGGLCGVLISMPPTLEVWKDGTAVILIILFSFLISGILVKKFLKKFIYNKYLKILLSIIIILFSLYLIKSIFIPSINFIENTNSAKTGYIGGLNLPIILSWPIAGLFCGVIAFLIGKIALGLRSDYLAIATLGISEIIIYIIKNEEWLARGVKNVNGLPRPVPYEIDLQKNEFIQTLSNTLNLSVIELSSLIVKGLYSILFILVLLIIFFLLQKAIKSPWGRMMRAVRDNEISAEAMGINVKKRHLQVFIIGSAIIGISGAMLTTLDGQFTPSSYQPLRYTFLIWIMVIIGGSGNNHGAIIGGFAIWFFWIQAEPIGIFLIELITIFLSDQNEMKLYLLNHAAYMRLLLMGLVLILALRFFPKGIIEEEKRL